MTVVEAGIKTFLIADVRGYTRFTSERGDEAAARLATRFAGSDIGHPPLVAPAPVASISFSPDGTTFATSGGSSGGTSIWETATQQQLGSDFPGGQGQWGSVAFTPDGLYLLAVFGDGTAFRWPVSVMAWETHACQVAGRNLTHEEWSRFVGGRSYSRVCLQFPAGP